MPHPPPKKGNREDLVYSRAAGSSNAEFWSAERSGLPGLPREGQPQRNVLPSRITWELVRDAESQAPLNLKLHFDNIPGDSSAI